MARASPTLPQEEEVEGASSTSGEIHVCGEGRLSPCHPTPGGARLNAVAVRHLPQLVTEARVVSLSGLKIHSAVHEGCSNLCGIVGFTHKKRVPDPDRIREATTTLIHRGPDQQGIYESKVCSMGATRLKIIDLESGDQPIFSDNGDSVIVFNGEIYNHAELRRELEQRGHRFRTRTDTEAVLRAFLEWDIDCFPKLRGMFAVALWTESTKRLVLCRDRMGIKPLYIARQGEDLLFGSELKAILIHPEIERRLSLNGLDCYLSLNYVPCPWTLVEGIEKLPPGHWLEWHDGEVRSDSYWTFAVRCAARTHSRSRHRKSLIRFCNSRFGSTCFPTYRSAFGLAEASIPQRFCTMRRKRPLRD